MFMCSTISRGRSNATFLSEAEGTHEKDIDRLVSISCSFVQGLVHFFFPLLVLIIDQHYSAKVFCMLLAVGTSSIKQAPPLQ